MDSLGPKSLSKEDQKIWDKHVKSPLKSDEEYTKIIYSGSEKSNVAN